MNRTAPRALKPRDAAPPAAADFASLVAAIQQVNAECAAQAARAVNVSLTVRNWLIGAHIHHYELHGSDRAKYGDGLLPALADRLSRGGVTNTGRQQLYKYTRFYRVYPEIVWTLSRQFAALRPSGADAPEQPAPTADGMPPALDNLPERLSYSHLELVVALDSPLARRFYEAEAVRGGWSVRELRRAVAEVGGGNA